MGAGLGSVEGGGAGLPSSFARLACPANIILLTTASGLSMLCDMNEAVRQWQAQIGKLGGQAGRGEAKRRPAAHYRRIARLAVAARLKKWAGKKGGKRALASLTN